MKHMTISTRQFGDVVILDLQGKMTADSGATTRFRDKANSLLLEGHRALIVNLGEVRYMDSGGLGELVRAYASVKREGGAVKLLNLTSRIQDLLTITKLVTVFESGESEAELVESFEAKAA